MEDILKQERQKLHMAADNIKQMLGVIESHDEQHFFWAWMQLEENLNAAKQCFIGVSKEFCDKLDKFFETHKHTLSKLSELHKKIKLNPDIEALSEEELKDITKGLEHFLKDLGEKFGFEELEG